MQRLLSFHGFTIRVSWPDTMKLDQFCHEFLMFDAVSGTPDCDIALEAEAPDPGSFSHIRPSYYTPRNICYLHQRQKIVNYHGKALLIQDKAGKSVRIITKDADMAQSILYTVLIYQTGRHFDRRGTFRVHALGFTYKGKGALVLLPMGGGKSTLILELLKDPEIRLLSEDTPLISGDGKIHSFPVKIGILPGKMPNDVPPEHIKRIRHIEGVEKDVIDLAYFKNRIATEPAQVKYVFAGERFLGNDVRIIRLGYCATWKRFFRDCVVGLGVYQGLEFAITAHPRELVASLGLALRRALTCSRFLRGTQRYELQLGNTPEKNAAAFLSFLRQLD